LLAYGSLNDQSVKNVTPGNLQSVLSNQGGQCALAIMTKAPVSGQVKTRLTPPLTPAEAAALNRSFLQDTAALLGRVGPGSAGIVCFTPAGAADLYSSLLPPAFGLLPQRGETLEDRIRSAFDDLFLSGFDSVCLIGSDSPTIPLTTYVEVVELLRSPQDLVVVGPADDGGYYLIGLKKPHPELFYAIDWSTDRVLDQTIARAADLRLQVHMLPPHYDVDDSASLARLCRELFRPPTQSTSRFAPATTAFLRDLIAHHGELRT
jgi:hypothetical protein